MKSRISLIIASLLVALSFASTATAKKAAKVDICHFDKDAGLFHVINVSSNAESMHRARHGDVDPGTYFADTDGDGIGAGYSVDACPNGDLVTSSDDNCPNVANSDQADLDGDGIGDPCDDDRDDDGKVNGLDACPDEFPLGNDADGDGCTDPVMVACPCGTATEAASYFDPLISGTVYRRQISSQGWTDRWGVGKPTYNVARFFTGTINGAETCALVKTLSEAGRGNATLVTKADNLTTDEFNACKNEIDALAEDLGVPVCPIGLNSNWNVNCIPPSE